MYIKCFRCERGIDTPNASNADYVMAQDTIVKEPREILLAVKHNQATLAKQAKIKEENVDGSSKYPDLVIADSEYTTVEMPDIEASKVFGEDLVRVIAKVEERKIQKTGIICPGCYRETDTVIWGVHKSV